MSVRDYNKQKAGRQRIRRTTLVVGVEIGKAGNAVGFMDQEGKVLGSCAKLYNSREGLFLTSTAGERDEPSSMILVSAQWLRNHLFHGIGV